LKKAILLLVSLAILLLFTATFVQAGANQTAKEDLNGLKLGFSPSGVDVSLNVLSADLTSTLNHDQSLGESSKSDVWPVFRQNAMHTGRSPYVGAQTSALKWVFNTNGTVFSSPAIGADGTIYVGSADYNLYAINPDGTMKWSYKTGGTVDSSPAVGTDGTVYVGSSDSKIYAINPNGTLHWDYLTISPISSSPAIDPISGNVYVASSYDSSWHGRMYAFFPNGSLEWVFNPGTSGSWIVSTPAITPDGTILFGDLTNHNSIFWALNPDGSVLWQTTIPNARENDLVSSPAVSPNGMIYVGEGDGDGYGPKRLVALNQTGQIQWSFTTGDLVLSSPAIAVDGTIYVGSYDGNLYAVNADGTLKYSYFVDSAIYSSPAIDAEGTIYIGSTGGSVFAINSDNSLKWEYATGDAVFSSPTIGADGSVYVGSNDGNVYCFGQPKVLDLLGATGWYWNSNTAVNSIAVGDVNGDGQKEVVSGGSFFDGTRNVAQLIVWDSSYLAAQKIQCWYWTGNTVINSVAVGDVDGDGQVEIVTGGSYFDGARNVAQLVVWSGSDLSVERIQCWYWTGDTVVNSVAVGNVDGNGQVEIVTGGSFNDGTRTVAQLIEWNGLNLSVDRLTGWYWTKDTSISSVALGDVDGDGQVEVVTGGAFNDGARDVAQLIEWNGANLAVDRLTTWYWTGNTVIGSVALGDVDDDGLVEVVTGGEFFDGSRNVAQLIEWTGANLVVDRLTSWYWTSDTYLSSIVIGDVDRDGQVEIASGGYFNEGSHTVAQLIEWNGINLGIDRFTTWYWTSDTMIYSVAGGDVNADGQMEVATGGGFFDGAQINSQLTVWGVS
jgi:outer membrane protein assembly factor BamB